jgi:hypothetical protein
MLELLRERVLSRLTPPSSGAAAAVKRHTEQCHDGPWSMWDIIVCETADRTLEQSNVNHDMFTSM